MKEREVVWTYIAEGGAPASELLVREGCVVSVLLVSTKLPLVVRQEIVVEQENLVERSVTRC